MGLTVSAGDPRATAITDGRMTWGNFWGVDASVANGAQAIASIFDRESTTLQTFIRGTSGTTNIVPVNVDGENCYITVAADQTTLTSSGTVVV